MDGIAVAGTILVDKINEISVYPNAGELTQISDLSKSVGGCVPNTAIDIATLDNSVKVYALGKTGSDEDGSYVIQELSKRRVDVSKIRKTQDKQTTFTNVMSIKGGQRTFFVYAGASNEFGYDDIDFNSLGVKMLHLGYFLLLKKVDDGDGVKILKKCKELGIKTSVDLVSENSDRYSLVLPCLKYVDNLIINETEAERLSGIAFNGDNLKEITDKLKSFGVSERVIVHLPKKAVCNSNSGYTEINSFSLPSGFIKGTTGAGDAFCAGALIGIYKGLGDEEILKYGQISALGALSAPDAVSGMKSMEELTELSKNLRRSICL